MFPMQYKWRVNSYVCYRLENNVIISIVIINIIIYQFVIIMSLLPKLYQGLGQSVYS